MRQLSSRLARDAGSVTAELATTLPVFVMLLALMASVAAGQVLRAKMAALAADAARARAIGEIFLEPVGSRVTYSSGEPGFVCATAATDFQLPVLRRGGLLVSEIACTKQLGR